MLGHVAARSTSVTRKRSTAIAGRPSSSPATPPRGRASARTTRTIGDMREEHRGVRAVARAAARTSPASQMGYGHVAEDAAAIRRGAARAYRAAIARSRTSAKSTGAWRTSRCSGSRARSRRDGRAGGARGPEPERRHPFPLRARQGVRGHGRLRSRLGLLPHRQSAAAASGCPTIPSRFEVRHEEIAEVFTPGVPRQHAGQGFESGRADLHRRPAALGLDADRADPREPQPGRRHRRAADAGRIAVLDRPLSARPHGVSGSRARAARPGLSRLRQQYIEETPELPRDRQAAASPTSCRTTSRTSASRT